MLSMCLWWQYLRLVRGFKYYGYIVFKPCTSDYPQPDTKVTVATGNKELNFRIHRKVRTVKNNKRPRHLLEHGAKTPRRLLETGVY